MAATVVAALLLALSVPASAASGKLPGHFGGSAYATSATANAGQLAVRLGRSAFVPCPCLGTGGKINTNRVTDVEANDLASIDVTGSKAFARKTDRRTASTWTMAEVAGLDLLDGLITADLVRARANVRATPSTKRSHANGSRFVNLVIAGTQIAPAAKPGKRIDLSGLGFVKLFEVRRFGGGLDRKGIQVVMIRVTVTVGGNIYDLPVGVEIEVERARSVYDRLPVRAQLRGEAFGTRAASEATIIKNRVGKAAALYLGCEGSGGRVKTNTVTDF